MALEGGESAAQRSVATRFIHSEPMSSRIGDETVAVNRPALIIIRTAFVARRRKKRGDCDGLDIYIRREREKRRRKKEVNVGSVADGESVGRPAGRDKWWK